MKNYFKNVVLITSLFVFFIGNMGTSKAVLEVDITEGNIAPMPIAITGFQGSGNVANTGAQIASIVTADLERCGLFQPLDPASFIQTLESLKQKPRFGDWRAINAQTLVSGEIKIASDGQIQVEYAFYDVISESRLEGMVFKASAKDYRVIAHKIADSIYKRVTGDNGYFNTKIVYVSETGPPTNKVKKLAIMDQDGFNNRFLTTGQSLVLTPRFSPSTPKIAYLDFIKRQPKVYLMDLSSGQRELLGNFKGMTFAPRFSHDGSSVVMSFAAEGRTSLYKMNLSSRAVQRLTEGNHIDTSPCYSPDGSQLVFNSDRGGTPQLYIMPASGGEATRISFGKGRYQTPVWSPRGDLIAFTKLAPGAFYIGVMKSDGSGERLLAQGHVVEDPCWSPNGRVIMFTRVDRSGKSRVYTIDLTGYNEREISTPTGAAGACWSPLIQ
ncbi:MAG: Tol-Pal system beta propeller repeat protein TolB [Janthinobacterium lividum]